MLIVGYILAIFIGLVMGLIGGGGSILAVPIFVYLLKLDPLTATGYSLFVVGAAALVGGFRYWQKGLVDLKTAVIFAIPSLTAVFLTRKFLMPALPDVLFAIGEFEVGKNLAIMVFFGFIMFFSALSMIRSKSDPEEESVGEVKYNYPLIMLEGLGVGVLTGIVGAGGGIFNCSRARSICKTTNKACSWDFSNHNSCKIPDRIFGRHQ